MTDKIKKLEDQLEAAMETIDKLQTKVTNNELSIHTQTNSIAGLNTDLNKTIQAVNNNVLVINAMDGVMQNLSAIIDTKKKKGIIVPN